jgi:hypothetical protein
VTVSIVLACFTLVPASVFAFGLPWQHLARMRSAMDERLTQGA